MNRKPTRAVRLFAKVAITAALPIIIIWTATEAAIRAARFEIWATFGEYLAFMREKP